ncbi:acyl-CoA dehydrogenase [uncultured Desulfosarcina sp.]|uniref:acyl-CoA dehydrogenase n=1 Tax=uncultured Desulfosarcina sp. TaxID=218289 RepID=UPI0029C8922C|nr:acyl-CoA dehydrogenase [uncultured Desulfosarcina sp.]
MARLLVDDRDIKFVLFELLKIQELCAHEKFSDWNEKALDLLLGEALKFSEKVLFPLNIEGDKIGLKFESGQVTTVPGTKAAYRDFVEGGWLTPCEDELYGGQALPEIIKFATHEMFFAANFPFMCYVNLTHDAAKLIELFGTDDQKQHYLAKMYGGRWTGTMCLTEPSAGSDVGAIETRAIPAEDGTYRISGQKIFITNGENDIADNIVHMVLARIDGDPAGVKGLSIFIVPKYRLDPDGSPGEANDVRCIGIEHKMGLNASPTTTLSFGEKGQCHGYLLGNVCKGIKIMFHMMNASRLEVGMWGQGTSSVSYLHALDYAKGRRQGPGMRNPKAGPQAPIVDHPDIRRVLLMMKSLVEGMRAMLYYSGYAMDQAETAPTEDQRKKWHNIVEVLIPICKAYPTEKGVDLASHAIQVYGGYGYTQEYPVEQFMRDSKVACIFEGTTGIQAMDFALRKVGMKGGQVFAGLLADMDAVIDKAGNLPGWEQYAAQVRKTKTALGVLPAVLAQQAKDTGIVSTFLQATPFLDATGDVLVAYFLLWSAVVAEEKLEVLFRKKKLQDADQRKAFIEKNASAAFLAGKKESARFFIANMLPITDGKLSAIGWGDLSAWEIAEKSF